MSMNFTKTFCNVIRKQAQILLLSAVACCGFWITAVAQQPAFPGAEGGGRFATGGRGGTVYEVTNLNDAGAGSLRDAVSQPNRTIVFRVSGIIHLASRLSLRQNNITIAGQTAPGDGITVTGYTMNIQASNIIIRHIRCRLSDVNNVEDDAMNLFLSDTTFPYRNIIIDHCSLSWSVDETGSFYGAKDFTLQWCILSESLYNSAHPKGAHGYGGIWGGNNATFHHNLLAHHTSRNPRFSGSRYTGRPDLEVADMRNNVIYNWGGNSSYGGEGGNYNIVNNYYKPGPATSGNLTTSSATNRRNRILHYTSYYYGTDAAVYPDTLFGGKFYIDGNYVAGYPDVTADNWTKGVQKDSYANAGALILAARQNTPFATGAVTTQSAEEAYLSVLADAGATLPRRDAIDTRVINETRNGTATYAGATYSSGVSSPSGIIDSQGDVGGFPVYNSTPAPTDTDHDGMPDAWETANSLNPNDPSDRNTVHSSGYTMLEVYLNSIMSQAGPEVATGASFSNFSQVIGTPSDVQTYSISGANLTGNITVTPPAGYELSTDGTTWYTNASPLVLVPNAGTVVVTVSVRLNAATEGSYAGNITHASPGATTVTVPVNGSVAATATGLGSFPEMDGGFENQTVKTYNWSGSRTAPAEWEASARIHIRDSDSRTGTKHLHYDQASTSVKYIFSPELSANPLNASTTYVVQFWYRATGQLTGNTSNPLKLQGSATIVGATGGTGTQLAAEIQELNDATPAGQWFKYTGVLTTSAATPTSTYSGIKLQYPQSPYFDIDDYVVYEGSAADATAPGAATGAMAVGNISNNSVQVNWSAPAGGVDGGGYIVVRSEQNTAPVPNENGIYIVGNTMGAGYEVAYIGNGTSFVDAGLSPTAHYYYYIFSVDKAYNYNTTPATADIIISQSSTTPFISTSGTLNAFSQTVGLPSTAQTFSVSGGNLTQDITVTPPAGYELSLNGTTWNAAAVTLPHSNGFVSGADVSVRLNAAAAGSYAGDIVLSSAGVSNVNMAVSGSAFVVTGNPPPAGTAATVALDGSGDYTSVQAAIDAAPTGRTTPWIIYIKNGRYKEKVSIPSNKPFIYLVGQSVANTIIVWDDYAGKVVNGVTIGTSTSATVTISAADCYVADITMENEIGYTGDGPQALAMNVNSDRCVFKNCRFIGGQDTVLAHGDGKRQYFRNCYIDGNTDFIFGSSIAVFDSCVVFPRDRLDGSSGGYITAANTPSGQTYGYVFRDCKITKNRGVTNYTLGRPWQNSSGSADKKHNKVVFLNTIMSSSIKPEGWSAWDAGTDVSVITYAEYKTRKWDGSLMDVSGRVSWSKQLTDTEAAAYYNNTNLFGSWDPCTVITDLCTGRPADIAVSNFRAKKGTGSSPSLISWNISWPINGITCELYRSTDNTNFSKIDEQIIGNDSTVSLSYSDPIPPPGVTYYYYVIASKGGWAPHSSDTVLVSSTPTITVNGELDSFLQGLGAPSAAQAYSVSGENLPQGITITPPAGYEISSDGGAAWSAAAITLPQTSGVVAATTISVRLNATAVGTYSGNIVHTSTGAESDSVAVTGTVQADPLPVYDTLLYYPFTINNSDTLPYRDAGAEPGVMTFSKLTLSNGSVIPAYSANMGEAFAPSASGEGYWTTAYGGFGNNLNRTLYKQVVIKAKDGYTLRVDSLALNTSLYAAATGKLAVVYSKTGFAADSSDVTGGSSNGVSLLSTANGGFDTPALLANEATGNNTYFQFALAGASGVTLQPGDSLTVRLYYSTGSSSAGRYAKIRNLYFIGISASQSPELVITGSLNAFTQVVGNPSATQTYSVSGSNLTDNVTITPPAGYEVSADGGANWFTNAAPLTLTVSGETLAATTITVRLNAATAGSYTGDIAHSSTGATTQNLAVNGTVANPPPGITVTGTLVSFNQFVGTPSSVQTYSVSGSNLTGDVTITPPADYEVSADGGVNWFTNIAPLTLTANNGTLAATAVTVRLNASGTGSYTGDILHASTQADTVKLAVNGVTSNPGTLQVSNTPGSFSQTLGTPSYRQLVTITGSNLIDTVIVTPPVGYEVSLNGITWNTAPLKLMPGSGGAVNQTIMVRLNAGATGDHNGALLIQSSGVQDVTVALTGRTWAVFTLTPNPAHSQVVLYHEQLYAVGKYTVYNSSGVRMITGNTVTATNSTVISVGHLPAGIYHLEFRRNNQTVVLSFVKL